MTYTNDELHALGYAYGLITKHLTSKHDHKLRSTATMEQATSDPQAGLAIAMQQVMIYRASTDELNERLTFLLSHVQHIPDNPNERLTLQEQGVWQIGYYRGLGGLPSLLSDEPAEEKGIRAARKAKGLTQRQLAEKLGCQQVDVSRWESGKVKPTYETLTEIAKALDCPVDRLTDAK